MVSPLKRFTTQLVKLSEVLLMLYPEDKYFKKAKVYLDLGVQANPRLVHTMFSQHILKFESQILSQDDSFFLQYCEDKEKREELKKTSSQLMQQYDVNSNEYDVVDTIMEQCASYWKQLEEAQQETIWKYLKVLVVLSKRV